MTDTDIVVAESAGWLTPFADFVTPHGLKELPDDLSFEDWEKLGLYIGKVYSASLWALGDWLAFGEFVFGERYVQAAAATGRSEQGLMNIADTARAWPVEERVGDFGMHQELKAEARKDIESARALLTRAVDEGWTRDQLRAEIRPAVETKPTVLRLTVDEYVERFDAWPERVQYRNNLNKGMAAFHDYLR